MEVSCKPCLTVRLFLQVTKKYIKKSYQYYVEPLMYKHSKKFRERYNMKAYIQAIGAMGKQKPEGSYHLNPVISIIFGTYSGAMMDINNGIGYRKFKSKEEARKQVLQAISRYKPKFSDYLAELRSHSKVNQYVCVISEMKKSDKAVTATPEEAYRKTMEMINKRSSWLNDMRESDASINREAEKTGDVDKIINSGSLSTYVPKPKGGQNG